MEYTKSLKMKIRLEWNIEIFIILLKLKAEKCSEDAAACRYP